MTSLSSDRWEVALLNLFSCSFVAQSIRKSIVKLELVHFCNQSEMHSIGLTR